MSTLFVFFLILFISYSDSIDFYENPSKCLSFEKKNRISIQTLWRENKKSFEEFFVGANKPVNVLIYIGKKGKNENKNKKKNKKKKQRRRGPSRLNVGKKKTVWKNKKSKKPLTSYSC